MNRSMKDAAVFGSVKSILRVVLKLADPPDRCGWWAGRNWIISVRRWEKMEAPLH